MPVGRKGVRAALSIPPNRAFRSRKKTSLMLMSEVDISRAAGWGSRTSKTRSVSSCLRLRIGLSDVCLDETVFTSAFADDVDEDNDDLSCLSAFTSFFFARGLIADGLDFLDLTTGGSTVSEFDLLSSLSSSSLLSSS